VALIGRLKPGVTPSQAEADLGGMQQELNKKFKGYPPGVGILVTGLQADNARTVRSSLLLLLAAVSVLLLIACVNAGSLIIGRNSHRAGEFAVRMAVGCSPLRLLQQLTMETLILFTVSGIAGVAIAAGLIRLFAVTNPLGVLPAGGITVDGKVLALTVLMVCATSLIFGSIPAFRALRSPDADPLRNRAVTQGRKHLRSRMFFVGLEFALSVILLVSAGLLISTFSRINAEAPGYDTLDVLVADVSVPYRLYPTNADRTALADKILQRVEQKLSGARAGVALAWPFEVNGLNPIEIEGRHDPSLERMPTAAPFMAGPGYFDALAIPVLRGRTITAQDRADQLPVAVVNQEFARAAFAGEDPIGRHIRLRYAGEQEPSEPWLTIVGVVGTTSSIRYDRVQWDRYPAIYSSMFQQKDTGNQKRFDSETFYLYVRGPGTNARTISSAVHDVAPDLPVGMVRSTGKIVRELRAQPRLRAAMLGSFALFALILAAIGIYGVMTQMVEQRRREIGIRMALGAERVTIVRLVLRRALLLTGFGIVLGTAGTAVLTHFLRTLLYDVSPLDPFVFTGVILTLALVAIAGSYFPARLAVAIEPTEALRAE